MSAADPLAQLKDIHLPPPVSAWPPAPGWWLLAIILFIVFALAIGHWRRLRRVHAPARAARRELAQLRRSPGEAPEKLRVLSILVRRAAMAYADPASISALTGDAWLRRLDALGGGREFQEGPGRLLAEGPYRASASLLELDPVFELVERWLKTLPKESRRV